ncbi:MAG: AAA family ATPase [Planctomycetaceae bacterium]
MQALCSLSRSGSDASGEFPGNLPFVDALKFKFESPVTSLVGENGSGKSTLLEAIAVLCGFPLGAAARMNLQLRMVSMRRVFWRT